MLVSNGNTDLFKPVSNEELDIKSLSILYDMKDKKKTEQLFVQFKFYTGKIDFLFDMDNKLVQETFLQKRFLKEFDFMSPFMGDFIKINQTDSKDDIYKKLLNFYKDCIGELYQEFQSLSDGNKTTIDFVGKEIKETNFNFFNLRPIWANSNMFNHSQTSVVSAFRKRLFVKLEKDIPQNMLHWFEK